MINYEVGHGHVLDGELFQANCLDTVPEVTFLKSKGSGMKSLTHDFFSLYYNYDQSNFSVVDSVIFDKDTWVIDVCHVAYLVGSSPLIESRSTLKLDVEIKPPGGSFDTNQISYTSPSNVHFDILLFRSRWRIVRRPPHRYFRPIEV